MYSFLSRSLFSITEHIDFATPLQEPAAEPLCNANLAASMHTLDHLAGVANRAAIHYTGESQLREVGIQKHTYASLSISKHQEAKEYQKRKKAKGAICKNFSVKHSKMNYNYQQNVKK